MLEIDQAFNTTGTSVYEFFQRPGIGLYIPLYQREYSWDNDNVEQLLDDITRGIERLTEVNSDDEIRFLGTIISVTEKNKSNIEPVDHRGLPTAIEKIIDGQQRLSTICLFATQLYKNIDDLNKKITAKSDYKDEVDEICKSWKEKLLDIFSLDLKRGIPERKPQIIRGHDDKWIKDGNLEEAYKSDLANYLALFINYIYIDGAELPKPNKANVGRNTKDINKWLETKVVKANQNENDDFPSALTLISKIKESDIWQYERPELKELIINSNEDNKHESGIVSSLVRLFTVCHYLLDRCCFTLIQPLNDDWAFDMFQSLNASGTPLTAIETFKPLVVNTTNLNETKTTFKGSSSDLSFEKIDKLFEKINSAAQKSKLTNDFLTSLAIVIEGYKLTSHFSQQRKWLDRIYEDLGEYELKKKYINFVGNYAVFYKDVWLDYEGKDNQVSLLISSNSDAELASVILLYLKKSNHKMAVTILGPFYNAVLEGKEDSIKNFVDACKAIGAFYTIWRAAQSNAGLDTVYRQFFKGEPNVIDPKNWLNNKEFCINDLKSYLKDVLKNNDLYDKDTWIKKSGKFLNYKSKSLIQFLLILTAHDTIADPNKPGLMKASTKGVSNYLNLEKWNSKGVATIEHIAPQTKDGSWDDNLYDENDLYQSIGNLTLLPTEVNSSASNKGWKEKLLYYKHLSEQDPDKLKELKTKADNEGISLNQDTIQLLVSAKYNDHIKSLVTVGEDSEWNSALVSQRTERILSIAWDRLEEWL
ncbi:DUF262 domain-containing HNH endonuclease family protein [Myroides albus]|uniref:DUF262 domain-containing protein n=1 Tax=Myroides albus TaxID=2562892 RepID=UPI002158BF1B|nr:DUF262 domain-containing HNH endonuclease family protein [Myroides albus]UVD80049.1 DUF262 domain-containing HNH endonuclease family protein [Myroides albus]